MVRHRDWEELGIIAAIAMGCLVCLLGLCAMAYLAGTWSFWWLLAAVAAIIWPFIMMFCVIGACVEDFMNQWGGQ